MGRCFVGPPKVPTFNLTVNLWQNQFGAPPFIGVPLVITGALVLGERVGIFGLGTRQVYLLVPKLTDIHHARVLGGTDYVEVPAGTLRFYRVDQVDDVGRGYPNEYRQATILMVPPVPDPLT